MLSRQIEVICSQGQPSTVVLFFADREQTFVFLKVSGILGSGQAFALSRKQVHVM